MGYAAKASSSSPGLDSVYRVQYEVTKSGGNPTTAVFLTTLPNITSYYTTLVNRVNAGACGHQGRKKIGYICLAVIIAADCIAKQLSAAHYTLRSAIRHFVEFRSLSCLKRTNIDPQQVLDYLFLDM